MRDQGDRNRSVIDGYLRHLRSAKYSPKSVQTYGYALGRFANFLAGIGRERLQDVTVGEIEAYRLEMVERRLKPASQELFLRAVRNLFNWLEEAQAVFVNPVADLVMPKLGHTVGLVPSEGDVRRLLTQPEVATPIGVRDRAILEVAYCCGLRREELASLTVSDPLLPSGGGSARSGGSATLRVLGKGSKERVVPLGRQAVHWLSRYVSEARPKLLGRRMDVDALWIGREGRPLSGQGIAVMIKERGRRCFGRNGMPADITPHSLRRACATHMLRNGAHPVQIQMLLGHSSPRHLGQYLRMSLTELKAAHARANPGR